MSRLLIKLVVPRETTNFTATSANNTVVNVSLVKGRGLFYDGLPVRMTSGEFVWTIQVSINKSTFSSKFWFRGMLGTGNEFHARPGEDVQVSVKIWEVIDAVTVFI